MRSFTCKLLLLCLAPLGLAAQADTTSTPPTASPAASPAPGPAANPAAMPKAARAKAAGASTQKPDGSTKSAEPGFAIEPEPKWVTPLAFDGSPVPPGSPMHYESIDRQILVQPDSETHYERYVRVVDDPAGLERAALVDVDFDPSYQTLAFNRIQVVRQGRVINALDRKKIRLLQRETQLERMVYDGRVTASLALEDVRAGDRIEFAYTVRGRNPAFAGHFVDRETMGALRGPTALFRVRLLAPAARRIAVRAPKDAAVVENTLNGLHESIFVRRSVAQIVPDISTPASTYLGEELALSEFADWAAVAAWAQQIFTPATPGDEVKAKAGEIAAASALPAERLARALDFVQREVRYFGIEIGPSSHKPAEPDQVLRQRFGDCKDKVALLVALLRDLQIDADPVVASLRFDDATGSMLPSPLDFDHAIARVRIGAQTYWLDATRSRQTGPPEKRQVTNVGKVLVARDGEQGLTDTPAPYGETQEIADDHFHFEKIAEPPSLLARIRYRGQLAEFTRELLLSRSAEDVQKQYFNAYTRIYPKIQAQGPMKVTEVDGDNAIELSMQYVIPGFLRFPEQSWLIGDFSMWDMADVVFHPNENTRTRPLRVAFPGAYEHAMAFDFPEDLTKVAPAHPVSFDETNQLFAYHITRGGDARHIEFKAELRLLVDRIDTADWPGFVEHAAKVQPQIGGTLRIPPIRPDQVDKVRADLAEVQRTIVRGKVRIVTKMEAEARVKSVILRAELDSGRLPPEPRAEALLALGVQFDELGLFEEANVQFEQALKLSPDHADAYAEAAVNALLRRADRRSLELSDKALELKPRTESNTRFQRSLANYYLADYTAARGDLERILDEHGAEPVRSYPLIWLYFATRRAGGDAAKLLKDFDPGEATPQWPFAVVEVFQGKKTLDQAYEDAKVNGKPDPGRLCELEFFMGEKLLLDGDRSGARSRFRKSVDTNVTEFLEYALAGRELDVIGN